MRVEGGSGLWDSFERILFETVPAFFKTLPLTLWVVVEPLINN